MFVPKLFFIPNKFTSGLKDQCRKNKLSTDEMSLDVSVPLNYYAVFASVESVIPTNAYIVSEGANTMDIGRTILANHLPR
jgi:2-hydroxyacyl-CoA lyase 1